MQKCGIVKLKIINARKDKLRENEVSSATEVPAEEVPSVVSLVREVLGENTDVDADQ